MDEENKIVLVDLAYVAGLAIAGTQPKQVSGFRPFVLVPEPNGGMKVVNLEPEFMAPLPDHIRQTVTLVELESFVNYVKAFKGGATQIFGVAEPHGANFTAAIDYHEGKEKASGRMAHKAEYDPRYSHEFEAWLAINGKPLSQEQFLEHLRRWGYVITSHTEADLIELVSSLEFSTQGQFASKIERTRGGRKLLWNETVEGSGQVQGKTVVVPDAITIKAAIFLGGREYEITSDLLYRVSSGRLSIASELKQQQRVIRDAVKDLVKDVEAGTGLSVFVGKLG